jgi:crooked neck
MRALEADERNVTIRLKYIEMELKNKNINLARNLLDQTVTILPRVDQFWYKYVHMEEMLDNVGGVRQIFERWMAWKPDEIAWLNYIKMELRYNEVENARKIYQRFVQCHPDPKNWLKWTKFEEDNNNLDRVRQIFANAVEFFGDDMIDQKIYIAYAKFECRMKEYERARVIYKYALNRLPKSKAESLYKQYTQFEKQYGDSDNITNVVATRRRIQYEDELEQNPHQYDTWFDFVRLEENLGDIDRIREVYERAIAQKPTIEEKRFWRRYIYLWLNYAVFEESVVGDIDRTRAIYKACLDLIPHQKFTFAKVWLNYAHFEVRQLNLPVARKTLGISIGKCPKEKLFKGYIDLELQLREFDRVRTLYTKYLLFDPFNCLAWIKFAELEKALEDNNRCRAIFQMATDMPQLDRPELLWKAYIDFEIDLKEYSSARKLYNKLLNKTNHVKVWISYAQFELIAHEEDGVDYAREIFQEAYNKLKQAKLTEERVVLLEAWKGLEQAHGNNDTLKEVEDKFPKVIKRRRPVITAEGYESGETEEYFEYIFADDQPKTAVNKFLQAAMAHKKKQEEEGKVEESKDE